MNLDPYCTPSIKINRVWIQNLNVSVTTIKLLEENLGVNLCDLELGSGLLDMTPKVQVR